MIGLPAGTRIWIAAGVTDLRRGFTGLSAMVQTTLQENPFSGHVFVFRGRRGDLIKLLWWSGDGLCLFAKRLERGRFFWPQATSGSVALTPAQLSMLLEGIDVAAASAQLRSTDGRVMSVEEELICQVLCGLAYCAHDERTRGPS
jgi:transposase